MKQSIQTNKIDSLDINHCSQRWSIAHQQTKLRRPINTNVVGRFTICCNRKLRGAFAKIDWAQVDHYMDGFA